MPTKENTSEEILLDPTCRETYILSETGRLRAEKEEKGRQRWGVVRDPEVSVSPPPHIRAPLKGAEKREEIEGDKTTESFASFTVHIAGDMERRCL